MTTRAGAAAAARRPPLIADIALRTAFISWIGAPERSSALFTACLSLERQPLGRQRQQRRGAARDQAHH